MKIIDHRDLEHVIEVVRSHVSMSDDPMAAIAAIRAVLHQLSPTRSQPVDHIRWVPIARVRANDYNPNSVARNEMRLLHRSIEADGYTQPVVTVYDIESDQYVIVDGFHRYSTMRAYDDIAARTGGLLPIVVIDKPLNERMASTVRHNRARGKHSVSGMGNMVMSMLESGMDDAAVCRELGLEADELVRLKYVTGFAKLFENTEYKRAWESRHQILLRQKYQKEHPDESGTAAPVPTPPAPVLAQPAQE